jgi:phage antirepressor YoqD-like protein
MQIATINSQPTMSSREIAELTGKNHADVMRDIRNMLDVLKKDASSFADIYQDAHGRSQPCFSLDREMTLTLVSGYSIQLRHKIVTRLAELEAKQAPALPNFMDPAEAAMAWATEYKAKQAAQLQIAHMKPFADFGEAVSASATDVLIGDWIKAINDGGLHIGRNKAFQWFRSQGYLGDRNMPMQKYIDQGLFKVKEGLINLPAGQRATFTTMLTGKGQVYFANKLTKEAK